MLRGTPEAPTARHLNALICRISRGVTGASPVAACMVTWPGACNGVVAVEDRQTAQPGLRRMRPTRAVRRVSQRSACEDHQFGGRGQPLITSCRSVSRTLKGARSLCGLALKFVAAQALGPPLPARHPHVTESECYTFLHGKREPHGRSG